MIIHPALQKAYDKIVNNLLKMKPAEIQQFPTGLNYPLNSKDKSFFLFALLNYTFHRKGDFAKIWAKLSDSQKKIMVVEGTPLVPLFFSIGYNHNVAFDCLMGYDVSDINIYARMLMVCLPYILWYNKKDVHSNSLLRKMINFPAKNAVFLPRNIYADRETQYSPRNMIFYARNANTLQTVWENRQGDDFMKDFRNSDYLISVLYMSCRCCHKFENDFFAFLDKMEFNFSTVLKDGSTALHMLIQRHDNKNIESEGYKIMFRACQNFNIINFSGMTVMCAIINSNQWKDLKKYIEDPLVHGFIDIFVPSVSRQFYILDSILGYKTEKEIKEEYGNADPKEEILFTLLRKYVPVYCKVLGGNSKEITSNLLKMIAFEPKKLNHVQIDKAMGVIPYNENFDKRYDVVFPFFSSDQYEKKPVLKLAEHLYKFLKNQFLYAITPQSNFVNLNIKITPLKQRMGFSLWTATSIDLLFCMVYIKQKHPNHFNSLFFDEIMKSVKHFGKSSRNEGKSLWSFFKEGSFSWEHDSKTLSFGNNVLVQGNIKQGKKEGDPEIVTYKYVKNKHFEKLFAKSALVINKPTSIYIYLYSKSRGLGHANCSYIDHRKKEITRFESNHSKSFYFPINGALEVVAKHLGYSFIPPHDYVPEYNTQTLDGYSSFAYNNTLDPGGYCLVHSFFYLDFRLSNPSIDNSDDTRNALRTKMNQLVKQFEMFYINMREMIRNYGFTISYLRDKILEKNGTNVYELTTNATEHYIRHEDFQNIALDIVNEYEKH